MSSLFYCRSQAFVVLLEKSNLYFLIGGACFDYLIGTATPSLSKSDRRTSAFATRLEGLCLHYPSGEVMLSQI